MQKMFFSKTLIVFELIMNVSREIDHPTNMYNISASAYLPTYTKWSLWELFEPSEKSTYNKGARLKSFT